MGKDWDKPVEKFPLEDSSPKHVKKRGGKRKKYIIECRNVRGFLPRMRDWHIWKRYETRRQRDTALEKVVEKEGVFPSHWGHYEYRAKDPPEEKK